MHRIYAVSMKSVPIAIGFATITASQFAVGMYMTIITGREGGETGFSHHKFYPHSERFLGDCPCVAIAPPPIPNAFNLCLFSQHRDLEIASISISLFYGMWAYSLLVSTLQLKISPKKNRLPRVHVNHFPGGEIRFEGGRDPSDFENHD